MYLAYTLILAYRQTFPYQNFPVYSSWMATNFKPGTLAMYLTTCIVVIVQTLIPKTCVLHFRSAGQKYIAETYVN